MTDIEILDVTSENVEEIGVFCIKDKKSQGYKSKIDWFKKRINNGLKIKIAIDRQNKQLGFIEYIPSELAWRPVKAENFLFVQCIVVMSKEARYKEIGSILLRQCEQDAKQLNKTGVCTMSSDGPWMANRTIFEKNGYAIIDKQERFELLIKELKSSYPAPKFNNWIEQRINLKGWHLIYSDQCPWHEKSITDIKQSALDNGIELNIKKLSTPEEAQNAPSGFGTYSLIKDGKLLEDHYLSRTRFENILRKEL